MHKKYRSHVWKPTVPVFTAHYYQRGHGLGAMLETLRGAIPFLKPVSKSVGKSALAENGYERSKRCNGWEEDWTIVKISSYSRGKEKT